MADFVLKNTDCVVRTARVAPKNVNESARAVLKESTLSPGVVQRSERMDRDDYFFLNGEQLIFYKNKTKIIDAKFGKGYSVQNLFYMRQFYLTYPDLLARSPILHAARGKSMVTAARFQDEKTVAALGRQLGWTHMEGTQLTRGQAKAYIAQLIEEAVRS